MNNNYNYIDTENLYTYPNSKVLKNIPAIDDLEKLISVNKVIPSWRSNLSRKVSSILMV